MLEITNTGSCRPLAFEILEQNAQIDIDEQTIGTEYTGLFDYDWLNSDGPDLEYQFNDIRDDGTLLTDSGDDENLGPISLGFEFPFYGQWFEDVEGDWFIWAAIEQGILPYICGDTDCNGQVTPSDAYILLGWWASCGPGPCDEREADVNGDDLLTPADAYYILNFIASTMQLACDEPGCLNCP